MGGNVPVSAAYYRGELGVDENGNCTIENWDPNAQNPNRCWLTDADGIGRYQIGSWVPTGDGHIRINGGDLDGFCFPVASAETPTPVPPTPTPVPVSPTATSPSGNVQTGSLGGGDEGGGSLFGLTIKQLRNVCVGGIGFGVLSLVGIGKLLSKANPEFNPPGRSSTSRGRPSRSSGQSPGQGRAIVPSGQSGQGRAIQQTGDGSGRRLRNVGEFANNITPEGATRGRVTYSEQVTRQVEVEWGRD